MIYEVRWPSGLRRMVGNCVNVMFREFESLLHRKEGKVDDKEVLYYFTLFLACRKSFHLLTVAEVEAILFSTYHIPLDLLMVDETTEH